VATGLKTEIYFWMPCVFHQVCENECFFYCVMPFYYGQGTWEGPDREEQGVLRRAPPALLYNQPRAYPLKRIHYISKVFLRE